MCLAKGESLLNNIKNLDLITENFTLNICSVFITSETNKIHVRYRLIWSNNNMDSLRDAENAV